MNIWENKPLLIGGAVVIGGIVLLATASGGGGGSTQIATMPAGQSDAQIAAARDIQIASISAGAAASANNAQLAMSTQQAQADLARTQLQATLAQYQIDAENARAARELTVNADITRLQIQSQADSQTFLAGQQAAIAKYTLDQSLASQRSNNEFQLEYATAANNSAVMQSQINAQVVNNQLAANRDITLGVLTSQNNLEMAKLAANRDLALLSIQTDAALSGKAIDAQTAAVQAEYAAQQMLTSSVIGSLGSLKSKNRDDVLQALITGQGYYPVSGPSKTAQVIGAVGGAAGNIAKLVGGLF